METPNKPLKTSKSSKELLSEIFTMKALLEELVYGSIAGVVICLGGHPFDTIKVRMQMDNTSLVKTVLQTFKNEGPFAFYKGIAAPMASIPALNALVFSSYEVSRKTFEAHGKNGYFHIGLAGAIAGFINCIIVNPTELIKCKMQMQKTTIVYKSSWECAKQLFKEGGIRGINQGMYSCVIREVFAYMAQFMAYEYFKREVFGNNPNSKTLLTPEQDLTLDENSVVHEMKAWQSMVSGGIAGSICWLISFPPDVIKTKIQCAPRGTYSTFLFDGGFWKVGQEIWKEFGVRGFFKGYSAILGRALIANALGFYAWEMSRNYIQF